MHSALHGFSTWGLLKGESEILGSSLGGFRVKNYDLGLAEMGNSRRCKLPSAVLITAHPCKEPSWVLLAHWACSAFLHSV